MGLHFNSVNNASLGALSAAAPGIRGINAPQVGAPSLLSQSAPIDDVSLSGAQHLDAPPASLLQVAASQNGIDAIADMSMEETDNHINTNLWNTLAMGGLSLEEMQRQLGE